MTHANNSAIWAIAVLAALAISACGNANDGPAPQPSTAANQPATSQSPPADTPADNPPADATTPNASDTRAEDQVEAVFDQIQQAFRAGRPAGVCDNMTARSIHRTITLGVDYPNCPAFVRAAKQLFDDAGQPAFTPHVLHTTINGNRATTTVQLTPDKQKKYVFAQHAGTWKLNSHLH